MAFHVTPTTNLDSIIQYGLIPRIGENSQDLGETESRIYAFVSKQALYDGLAGWFGEIYEDLDQDLAIIEVGDEHFERVLDSNGEVFFECYSDKVIPSSAIVRIFDETWQELWRPEREVEMDDLGMR